MLKPSLSSVQLTSRPSIYLQFASSAQVQMFKKAMAGIHPQKLTANLYTLDFTHQVCYFQLNMTGLQRVYRHVDLGPGETIVLEREDHAVGLVIHHSTDTDNPLCNQPEGYPTHSDTAFRYRIVPTHHSVIRLVGSACVAPSERISEPASGQHHSSALLGVRRFKAYRHSHPLEDIRNDLNFAQPGPIYVVTRGTRVGFFPSLTIAQEFTLHVSSNAWKKCKDMEEAFDYYSRTYNETNRGLLGVQVLPATVISANPLIDETHPLNQEDIVLAMHRNGRVTIEREPADGNPFYPLDDLPAYSYREALVAAVEEQRQEETASAPTSFAPPSGPIVISDSDSDSGESYACDFSHFTPADYEEIEFIERAWTASQQVEYNEERAIKHALTASLSQQ
ncbi:hypothetical protein BT96DRAFT_990332 [Gymnopus androsaceus JB14]|uniref:Uncharacterized protein n=1 Tax=Gymnopus androsaceus JB14 TaxID=1447944 RepID=A0A6A4HZ34_9AGAR|nr:hypothetical protein BT96DRAFT_990332 [Gymnopus androsaceus JB14]